MSGYGVNVEVVRRVQPCRFYADPTSTRCRSCVMATHVRPAGCARTLCGHACLEEDGWCPLADTHPEDIEQIDRCSVCYSRISEERLAVV